MIRKTWSALFCARQAKPHKRKQAIAVRARMGSRVSEFLGLGEDKFVTKEGDPDGGAIIRNADVFQLHR